MEENSVDRVWDIPDDSDFFHQEVRSLEYRAYGSVLSAFRARGELTEERRNALNLIRESLGISEVRHKCEVRRVATNPRLTMIANKIQGCNTTQVWVDEGFCDLPYLSSIPRLPHAPAKLPESILEEGEEGKIDKIKEAKRKLKPTIRDFRKAQKIEKNFPSTLLNGWVSSDDDGKRKGKGKTPRRISASKSGKIVRQRKLSYPVIDSDTDDEISYKDLRRQGRIHVPKNFQEGLKDGDASGVASAIDPARFKDEYQVSPIRIKEEDESDETPTMHDAFVPRRKTAAAKSKSLEAVGAISVVKKQKHGNLAKQVRESMEIPLEFSEGHARNVTSTESLPQRPSFTRGRGRGMGRSSSARGMGRKTLPKLLIPTSKRKHLDEARVELRSDGESDKEEIQDESEHASPSKIPNIPNGYRREFGSPESVTSIGAESPATDVMKSDQGSPILRSPKDEDIDTITNQQKFEQKNYSSGDEMKSRSAACKPVIVRPPFPPPVFSTTLDVNSFNKKRIKFGEGDISASTPTSAMAIGPTASSLARRPHFVTIGQGVIIRPTGILPQRKAQPHILVNSKTQRLITSPLPVPSASVVQNNMAGVNPSSSVAPTSNLVTMQSLQLSLQQQQMPLSSSIVTVAGNATKPVTSFNIPMSTMQSINFSSTSASTVVSSKPPGSPSIILLQKPGGTPMPITSLSTSPGGVPALNANIQYSTINLQKGNNHRAVILRRANLPLNKGNVMILNSPADVALLSNLQHGAATGTQIGRIVPGSLPQSAPGTVTFSSSPIVFSSASAPLTSVGFSSPASTIESPIISSFAPTYESVKLLDSIGGMHHHSQEWKLPTDQGQVHTSSSKESLTSEGQTNSVEDTLSAKSGSQETVQSSGSQPNLTQVLDDYLGSLLSTEEMPDETTQGHSNTLPAVTSDESLPISTDGNHLTFTHPTFAQSSSSLFGHNDAQTASPDDTSEPAFTMHETVFQSETIIPQQGERHGYLPHFVQEEHVYMEPDHTEVVEEEVIANEDGLVPDAHASSSFDSLNFNFDPPQTLSEISDTQVLSNVGTTENVFENHLNSINFDACVIPGDQLMTSDDVAVELEITPEEVETITTASTSL